MKIKNWFVTIAIFLFGLSSFAQNTKVEVGAAFYVNGEPISKEEFCHFSSQERASVIQYFRDKYKIDYGNDFWNTCCEGTTPAEFLIKRIIDTLSYIKIQQIQAKKRGLIIDISYSKFLNELNAENTRRAVAKKNNTPIYGPVQYSDMVYYNYRFSNLVIQLKTKLNDELFKVTEEALVAFYVKERKSLGSISYEDCKIFLKAKYLNQMYYDYISSVLGSAKIEVNSEIINSLELK
jgi:hypothetical protein